MVLHYRLPRLVRQVVHPHHHPVIQAHQAHQAHQARRARQARLLFFLSTSHAVGAAMTRVV